jgi:4-amino-4-deoxy-L-arabinose transferase-like glycosyltransferase
MPSIPARVALPAILGLALAARLYEIGRLDVWVDEANLILTAQQPLGLLFDKLRLDSSPPLFYLLVHFWIQLFGDGSVALRMLSVLAGVGLVAATYWAGRELISRDVGLWGAFVVAASPTQAFFSQQVRMYALLPLLGLLAVSFLVRHLRDGGRRDFLLWLVLTVLALYTHNFAVYLLPVYGVLVVVSGQLLRGLGRWLLAAVLVVLAYLPWVPMLLQQLANPDHYAWYLPTWRFFGPVGSLLVTFFSYSPGMEYVTFNDVAQVSRWRGWPAGAAAALAGWGGVMLVVRHRERGWLHGLWPLVFLLVPMLGAAFVSTLLTPHYVPGRVDQMMFPAFALLVGAGLVHLRPTVLRVAVAVALLSIATVSKLETYPEYHREGFQGSDRDLALRIEKQWQPGDVVLTTSLTRASLEYYLRRSGVEAPFVSFPRDTASHLGSQNDERWLARPRLLVREANAVANEVLSKAGSTGRVFVIWARSDVNAPLAHDAMKAHSRFEYVQYLGRFTQVGTTDSVEVRLYRLAPDA